ncbi:MAG: hypothetical protein ABIP17_07910 [Ilumatobacteraceae bacterium]
MSSLRSSNRVMLTVAVAGLQLASCSRSFDDLAEPAPSPAPTVAATGDTVDATISTSGDSTSSTEGVSTEPTSAPATPDTAIGDVAAVTVADLPDIGVPGLDSTDAFCASWSRFAGSFQVVAVTAAFGSGPPEQLASLEVASSPVVTDAYGDLLANWPDELSSEQALVADDFLGPFARRLQEARNSLESVGADQATIDAIADAWVAGLARRDPSTPEFTVDLPDVTWAVIDAAAAEFSSRLVPFTSDPSLITDVDTPLTKDYLAVSCPDQGTLSGQEVDSS